MAKFVADIDFRALKEEVDYKKGDEFEMTVKRAEEVESNIFEKFPHIKKVMTRVDDKEETEKTKSSKKE